MRNAAIRTSIAKNVAWSLVASALLFSGPSHATEGGFSFFLPGTTGDIALATAPEPGWQVANTLFFQSGDASASVLQGNVNLDLDLSMVLDVVSATYTFEEEILEREPDGRRRRAVRLCRP